MNKSTIRKRATAQPNHIDAVFAALANSTRRELLRLLLNGRQPVQQLADHFDMRRPSISEHLKVFRDAGLVSERKQGRHRYYHLEAGPLMEVQSWLAPYERFWREKMVNLRQLLDEEADQNQDTDLANNPLANDQEDKNE